jgi:putative ATP-binding cassette transporter
LTTVLTRSSHLFAQTILLTTLAINLILGAAAFLLPQLFEEQRDIMMKLVPLLMFCILPMAKLISLAPIMTQAQAGLVALGTIQEQISVPTPVAPSEARAAGAALTNFRDVAYTNLRFSYRNPQGEALFATGPLQFRFSRGETIFLVGGNGSGKSTTLRLLTALYPAEGGTIAVDGRALDATEKAGFRELFSAIFVDFHLFDRLYGLEGIDAEKVRALLQEMGLGGKVEFREGRFTDLQLSTGQRKRLALIAALLEDRPIYVFDEWAAEQDAHFRHEFYTRILPALKARGKTVIAVSHDDRYWSVADRVVRLDLGQVLWDKPGQALKEKDTTGLDG